MSNKQPDTVCSPPLTADEEDTIYKDKWTVVDG